jgi:hypothetical protein
MHIRSEEEDAVEGDTVFLRKDSAEIGHGGPFYKGFIEMWSLLHQFWLVAEKAVYIYAVSETQIIPMVGKYIHHIIGNIAGVNDVEGLHAEVRSVL